MTTTEPAVPATAPTPLPPRAVAGATQVYVLYINAPLETVWTAITEPEQVARFFHGQHLEADYRVGGRIRSWSPDHSEQWGDNLIEEYDPPHRLVHTWKSLYDADMAAEPASRVTWELEAADVDTTKLTLVHDRLDDSPKTAASVVGWAWILSNLKTVLETGAPLPSPHRA
ncbi:MAG TPA: SRPBCC family protein [Mycobacteriales bacterium]|nr:SRPBCC family protein [Mycobacteriales bacterium]